MHLYEVLRRLAARGDAVIVIEHHVDLLNACDRLVELGPGGGEDGGRVIASGTPGELADRPVASITGPFLGDPRAHADRAATESAAGARGGQGARRLRMSAARPTTR